LPAEDFDQMLPADQQSQRQRNHNDSSPTISKTLKFTDQWIPCREHLDPHNSILPTSNWIKIMGTLPITSLEEVLSSVEKILYREVTETGVVDLDAPWNPIQDEAVPTISPIQSDDNNTDNNSDGCSQQPFQVQAAHVILSPFGRPTGWKVKLYNASMVNALLTQCEPRGCMRVGWKLVQVQEYDPLEEVSHSDTMENTLVVDDSMVRVENCPSTLNQENLRHMLSRYELAPRGDTIIKWKGKTNDGKVPQPMYVVRFSSAAWARAAVRELQNTAVDEKSIKLIQYPRQLLESDS